MDCSLYRSTNLRRAVLRLAAAPAVCLRVNQLAWVHRIDHRVVKHCFDSMRKIANRLGTIALVLSCIGLLLVCEVIRPFRNLSIDGPLALISWGVGAMLGFVCLFLRGRSLILSVITLLLNLIPLLCLVGVLWLLGHSNLAWH